MEEGQMSNHGQTMAGENRIENVPTQSFHWSKSYWGSSNSIQKYQKYQNLDKWESKALGDGGMRPGSFYG